MEIQEKIAEWRKAHPDLVHQTSLGRTLEGRDIPLLRISDNAGTDEDEPEVLLLSGIHPREQQPQICIVRLVDDLLNGYGKDPRLTRLVNEREIWIVPVFNVDGKVYDMRNGNGADKGADWRKNRRKNPDGSYGVDLNRNFAVRWGGNRAFDEAWKSTTDDPKGNIYEGPAPMSEPETKLLARFIAERPLRAFMDIHSPLRIIYFPPHLIGPEYERYQKLATRMRALQKDPYPITEARPDSEPPPRQRGGNTGLTYHWSYYTRGVYGFNFEIGLEGRYPDPEEIEKEYRANVREPLLYFLEASADLPLAKQGSAVYQGGAADAKIVPGALVSWKPNIAGRCDYAVLVSENPSVVVLSEYRLCPVRQGFTLQVSKEARPGRQVPMALYLWDRDRGCTVARFTVTIE
jgi:carboxypeptidase T